MKYNRKKYNKVLPRKKFVFNKDLLKASTWAILLAEILFWMLCSCEQKDLCYNHDHASNVTVDFDWSKSPEANPSSMLLFLFPRQEGEYLLKKEFIGRQGGNILARVGVDYSALGFNSNVRNLYIYQNGNEIEAHAKSASVLDRLGLLVSDIPQASGTEYQRVVMEPDSLWSAVSDRDISISLEENDNGEIYNLKLYPEKRFCTYSVKIKNVANVGSLSASVAGSLSGQAGGVSLMDGTRTSEDVIVTFPFQLTKENALEGQFNSFGCSVNSNLPNKLVVYTVLKDDTKWSYVYDVTDQVRNAPDPYHIEIVLDKLPIPNRIENNSGFVPGVNDWTVIEIPVPM